MRTTLLLAICLSVILTVNAQNKSVIEKSKPYRVVDARIKNYFRTSEHILSVKIGGNQVTVQKNKLDDLSFEKIVVSELPDNYSIEGVLRFNEHLCLFYSLWDRAAQTEQLFYREIDEMNCGFKGPATRIVKVKGKVAGAAFLNKGFYNFSVEDKFDIYTSYDESKLMVQYRKRPEIKDDSKSYDEIGICIFDKDMKEIRSGELKMPHTEKKMNNLDYSIDSEGNAYILTTVYNDNTTNIRNSQGKPNYTVEILKVGAASGNIEKSITVNMGDHFVKSVWLFESTDNSMVCAGFYNDGRDMSDADGILMFKVDNQDQVSEVKSYEIPLELLNMYNSQKSQEKNEKKEKKDKAEFEDLVLSKMILQDDGSIILIGEQQYVVTYTRYYSNGTSKTYYNYYYNDMLITRINGDGSLGWMRKLPKFQRGSNGMGSMSFKYVPGTGCHYLLFLDNIKNLNLPMNEVPAMHADGAGGFLTAYRVDDASGVASKISIFDMRDALGTPVYQFSTNRITSVAPDQFVLELYKKKKEDLMFRIKL